MLRITIPAIELYDEINEEFVSSKEQQLQLEHSLVSLSKWEAKWCKPFLTKENKTFEETVDYVKCMTLTQNVDPKAYGAINTKIVNEINKYIDAPMSATVLPANDTPGPKNPEQVTSELIYYWMVMFNIPFECQKWHLNRLLMLINICNIKNSPKKKTNPQEIMSRNKALNEQRRAQLNTKG